MAGPVTDDAAIRSLLGLRTWAVVGCSATPMRDSHQIARMLESRGYRVIPVNPELDEVLGERCYPSLREVPEAVDVVDVFRRSSAAGAHVDEAAAERARAAGLEVVMDRCPRIEMPRLRIEGPA